jgi:hypothetical protein
MAKQRHTQNSDAVSPEQSGGTPELPAEVAALYTLRKGLALKFMCADFGEVDLTRVSLAFAAQLAEAGYLIKLS